MPVLRGARAPRQDDGDLELEALQQAGGAGLLPPMAQQQEEAAEDETGPLEDLDEAHRSRRFDVHRSEGRVPTRLM